MAHPDGASTFAKGLRVLECFETGRSDMTMADIARETGFDRATTRRLCLTLEDSGYLVRGTRAFRLSPRIVAIAGGFLSSHDIGRSVQPILNQFAEEIDGEIALAVRDGTRAIYIARSAVSSARLSFGFSVGSTLPLLPTAVGRMLLASRGPDLRDALVSDCAPVKYTEATELDPDVVRTKIAEAAGQGYAYAVNEFEMGAAGLAVPVPAIGGREAVLGTTAPANQLSAKGALDDMLGTLRRAAMSLR